MKIVLTVSIPEEVLREEHASFEQPAQPFEDYLNDQSEALRAYASGWWLDERVIYEATTGSEASLLLMPEPDKCPDCGSAHIRQNTYDLAPDNFKVCVDCGKGFAL